jgi:hypothetical protein
MNDDHIPELETDPRFPSGPWVGYFVQFGKHLTELRLTFKQGAMTGEGRDWVGDYLVRGRYDLANGKCYWTKSYIGQHDVFYDGYNEGKGIWGRWEVVPYGHTYHGGFHIWPEGMDDPTQQHLAAEADLPAPVEEAGILVKQ